MQGAVNFAVYSSNATGIRLVLFTEQDLMAGKATAEIELSPINNQTGEVWHIMLPNMKPGLLYGKHWQLLLDSLQSCH